MSAHPVIEGLRKTLAASRSSAAFTAELEQRIRQLLVDMVDGRVLPEPEAAALRASLVDLVRTEAIPRFADKNPSDALRILDMLKAYSYTQLETERAALEAARAAMFPAPPPATWPELTTLRTAAAAHPDACRIGPPGTNVYFAKEMADGGAALPDDVLALYAWADTFDLACIAATYLPVFSFVPQSLDISDAADGYPRRAAVFQGGDEVQLAVYKDRKKQWWLVYEYEYEPIGKKALDVQELLRFAIRRMNDPTADELLGELSWDRFFDIKD